MDTRPFVLPQPVGQLLSCLPAYPGTLLLVTGLNAVLAKNLASDVTEALRGKKLRLCVRDAHWTFDFAWAGRRFVPCQNRGDADLTISASAHDFFLLARRQEDPDTLFFSRRLSMEGDTELGLLVKNTIDAIELPTFNPEHFLPAQVLARLRARFVPR